MSFGDDPTSSGLSILKFRIVCSPSGNNTLFNIEINNSGSLTNNILNIKSLVKGKKFLDIGLVLLFYF
ncbi:hypothetical protein LEP1GSC081_1372 [Leptospira kirschneri str. H1]|uniref:Uncharacterized protein n=1 Tax=Leptospira kirschneri str. H1 TaxID=1049966 RepID=A0A0E2B5E0_9LEPT|nr:hypothetical protein LEP1GSC081_1372 [Leptospira kirschneri str. H1]